VPRAWQPVSHALTSHAAPSCCCSYDDFGRIKKKFRSTEDRQAREAAALARLRGEWNPSVSAVLWVLGVSSWVMTPAKPLVAPMIHLCAVIQHCCSNALCCSCICQLLTGLAILLLPSQAACNRQLRF
jgi:hypothetical protein